MDTKEKWRWVPGYEGHYEVSSFGRMRSHKNWRKGDGPRIMKHCYVGGYPAVSMHLDGGRRQMKVHRCVALAFLGQPPKGQPEVRHLDGDRDNPRLENLAWGSRKENSDDRWLHGTDPASLRSHCKNGHEYTPANTRYSPHAPTHRVCKICASANALRGKRAMKARRRLAEAS